MFGSRTTQPEAEVLSTERVLQLEFKEIWGDVPPTLAAYYEAALEKNQAALCLSGGGIRSAAFALGVLEALAKKGLLTKFHYLSTVSGGGYIGGFLTRWIQKKDGSAELVQHELGNAAKPGQPEPRPIQWLREYSNFLTPRTGLASTDTWSAAVLWIRNTLVNWFVFLPFFLIVVGVPNLYLAIMLASSPGWVELLLAASFVLIAFATYETCRGLPSHSRKVGEWRVFRWVALPSLAAAFLLPVALAPYLVSYGDVPVPGLGFANFVAAHFGSMPGGTPGVLGGFVMTLGLLAGYVSAWIATRQVGFGRNIHIWFFGALISGVAVEVGVYLIGASGLDCTWLKHPGTAIGCNWRGGIYATVAPVWIVISQLLLSIFYTAFRRVPKEQPPNQPELSPDLDREWLARLSAVKLRFAVVAAFFTGLALIGPILFFGYLGTIGTWLWGFITAGSGATAVLGGKSKKSASSAAGWMGALTFNRIVLLAAVITIALLTIFLSALESWLATSLLVTLLSNLGPLSATPIVAWLGSASALAFVLRHLIVIGFAFGLLQLTSRNVSVNRFSLNAVYRNRISRAFLGAVRKKRKPDHFTGFDPADNIRMSALIYPDFATGDGEPRRVLFPVINLALNLVSSTRLAWQERKAHSFVVTPLASGSPVLGMTAERQSDILADAPGAYVRTDEYAGSEIDARRDSDDKPKPRVDAPGSGAPGTAAEWEPKGMTLATAMSISGAAASPSMGYNSSPATAFLMTLFNVRLGAWLPNPGFSHAKGSMQRSSPETALRPFLRELSGRTDDLAPDIYLSDGGHFENLGLYEMIRRRCRYIVVSDAGCDPTFKFEDLGNAIRKVMADIDGVAITFKELKLKSRNDIKTDELPVTFALGEINYGDSDEDEKKDGEVRKRERKGKILYLKPSYFTLPPKDKSGLSVDIRAYASSSDTFPHESTGDQWFSESQFESYRRLGEILVSYLGTKDSYSDLASFFEDLITKTVESAPSATHPDSPVQGVAPSGKP